MFQREVAWIFIRPVKDESTTEVQEVRAVPGRGLEGDHYYEKPDERKYAQEATLIESETIEAVRRECGIELSPGASRRNIVTRGVALNHLVDREFQIGEVRMIGTELCEPCAYLEEFTQKKGVMKALLHRGGLRARIMTEGIIHVGDAVQYE